MLSFNRSVKCTLDNSKIVNCKTERTLVMLFENNLIVLAQLVHICTDYRCFHRNNSCQSWVVHMASYICVYFVSFSLFCLLIKDHVCFLYFYIFSRPFNWRSLIKCRWSVTSQWVFHFSGNVTTLKPGCLLSQWPSSSLVTSKIYTYHLQVAAPVLWIW